MHKSRITGAEKGWALGPWNSSAPFAVGWARQVVDQPHLHARVSEAYLVVSGTGTLLAGDAEWPAEPGDVFFLEPGEPHGWLATSPDFLMFMIHSPVDPADKTLLETGE